jgi:hypothetical protein
VGDHETRAHRPHVFVRPHDRTTAQQIAVGRDAERSAAMNFKRTNLIIVGFVWIRSWSSENCSG